MDSIYIEIIGLFAAFLTTIGFVPQLYKIRKENSSEGVSLRMYFILLTGVILWFFYGLLIGSLSVIVANIVAGILQIFTIILVLRNRKTKH